MLISVKEIINKSVELYQKNYLLFFRYLLLLFIPTGIIAIAGVIIGSFTAVFAVFGLSVPLLIYLAMIIVASLTSLWISLAFVRTIAGLYENTEEKPIKENLQTTVHLILPSLIISILTSLIILGGMVLLIIPGIIFAIWFAFSFYAVAIDNHKVATALNTSKNLVRGRWWAVLWRLVAPSAVFGLFLILIQWLIGIPLEAIIKNFPEGTVIYAILIVIFALISTAVGLLFTPLTSAATVILYCELKKTPVENKEIEPPQV